MQVLLTTEDFDAFLIVTSPSGVQLRNDEAAYGLESDISMSMILTPMQEAGRYEVLVTSYSAGETGHYEVIVKTEECDVRHETGQYGGAALTYDIEGQAGQRVDISLRSGEFDTLLRVTGPDRFADENDDEGTFDGSTNSRLTMVLPANGAYQVEVAGADDSARGAFDLTIEKGPICGFFIHSELDPRDPPIETGAHSEVHKLDLPEGVLVEATMVSHMAPFLRIVPPNGQQFQGYENFGYAEVTYVSFYTQQAGTYQVIATDSLGLDGSYTLIVDQHRLERNN
jgi:hypothetical protein